MIARHLKISTIVLCCISSFLDMPETCAKSIVGMADARGEIVLPVKYDEIRADGPNRFRVLESTKNEKGETIHTTFFVDGSGKVITEPAVVTAAPQPPMMAQPRTSLKIPEGWKSIESFEFGEQVSSVDNRQGFVDARGKLTIFPSGQDIRPVGPGLFLRYSYNDGQTIELLGFKLQSIAVLPPEIEPHGKFSDGLLKVRANLSMMVGFINTEGKWQIKPSTIHEADDFKNGRSKVELTLRDKNACAVIDRNGNIVAGPYEDGCFPYQSIRDGQLVVEIGQQRAGVVTTSGKIVIPLEYDFILEENDYYVGRRDGNWIVFSRDGKTLVTLPKSICYLKTNVRDGMWIFAEGGEPKKLRDTFRGSPYPGSKFGSMRQDGTVVAPAKFDYIVEFIGNLALAGQYIDPDSGSLDYGVIDTSGKIILPMKYKCLSIENGAILIHDERTEFDSERWKKFPETNSRGDSWDNFLVTHDLIGMPEEKVFSILGKPDSAHKIVPETSCTRYRYSLGCFRCGNSWSGIEIEFDAKKNAVGWRSVGFDWEGEWNRENVVYVPSGPGSKRVAPKSVASEYR